MKILSVVFSVLLLSGANAVAQEASTAKVALPHDVSSKGFRVSLFKPILEVKTNVEHRGHAESYSWEYYGRVEDVFGLSLGYASLPVQSFGWTTNLSFIQVEKKSFAGGLGRADGNLAYTFSSIFNVKAGLNVSRFVRESDAYMKKPGIGFQSGLGIQISKNFGLDIGYIQMRQSGSEDRYVIDMREQGLEIGMHGTF